MKKIFFTIITMLFICLFTLSGCQILPITPSDNQVLAVESFLADITRQVAGNRLKVESLIPAGVDPHGFEPTPKDMVKISQSRILVLNGAGLEEWAEKLLESGGNKNQVVIEASSGLEPRNLTSSESPKVSVPTQENQPKKPGDEHHHEGDPHFWLDPIHVIQYVVNIRDGLIQADPGGKDLYTKNAEEYIIKLKQLDQFIRGEVAKIPPDQRLLVTNHESFGYFADRYGFVIIGTIIPNTSSEASPTAQGMAKLIDKIKSTKTKAIFLETGSNSKLAEQISKETGLKVVSDLYTHSLPTQGEGESNYIEMMKHNINRMVNALR